MSSTLSVFDTHAVAEAVRRLDAGALVALPTETVYGLAADATNGEAVARIFDAKGRPRFNPLIVHVSSLAMAREFVRFDALAVTLAERFWPGPLTLVLPARAGSTIHPLVAAGLPTLAVRMPQGIAADVIAALGRPLAAPSANRSGGVSPTTAMHVERSLGHRIDLVLDAGPATVGLESTILKPMDDHIVLLRAGGVCAGAVEAATGVPVLRPADGGAVEAPGQLASHYAPYGALRLDARDVAPDEWLVRFGTQPVRGESRAAGVLDLSATGDLREAAACLFAVLNELDRLQARRIAVMPVPDRGLGEAINDRLRRAAAPRPAVRTEDAPR